MVSVTGYRDPAGLFGLQRLNRFLDEAFAGIPLPEQSGVITSTWFAPTDVSEDAENIQISVELPGVDPEDVRLSLENNVLTIRGEKKQEMEDNKERVHRFERTYGVFERTFVLPNTVDPERIEARYENGVLFVTIPRSERARPREIQVKSSAGSSRLKTRSQAQGGIGQGSAEAGNGQETRERTTAQRGGSQGSETGAARDREGSSGSKSQR